MKYQQDSTISADLATRQAVADHYSSPRADDYICTDAQGQETTMLTALMQIRPNGAARNP